MMKCLGSGPCRLGSGRQEELNRMTSMGGIVGHQFQSNFISFFQLTHCYERATALLLFLDFFNGFNTDLVQPLNFYFLDSL